jgi:hypothetical protein
MDCRRVTTHFATVNSTPQRKDILYKKMMKLLCVYPSGLQWASLYYACGTAGYKGYKKGNRTRNIKVLIYIENERGPRGQMQHDACCLCCPQSKYLGKKPLICMCSYVSRVRDGINGKGLCHLWRYHTHMWYKQISVKRTGKSLSTYFILIIFTKYRQTIK